MRSTMSVGRLLWWVAGVTGETQVVRTGWQTWLRGGRAYALIASVLVPDSAVMAR